MSARIESHNIRERLTAGIEPQIAVLAKPIASKRWIELIAFPAIWLLGGAIVFYSFRLQGLPAWCLRTCGVAVAALALNAFVLLLHEGMHGVLFRNRIANRWISVALGSCVLIGFSAYKVMHIRHHRYLGDPRDPDDYDNYSSNPRLVWAMHFVRLSLGAYLYACLIPFLAFRHGRRAEQRQVATEYALLLPTWIAAAALIPLQMLFWYWLGPLMLVAAMTNIRGFTQHGLADAHDPLLASRSMHPNRVVSFLLLNENLHLEHHLFPEIPSYNLPAVQQLIAPRLPRAVVGRSYLAFIGKFIRATILRRSPGVVGLVVSDSGATE